MTYRESDDWMTEAKRWVFGEAAPEPHEVITPACTDWSELGYEAAHPAIESRPWLDGSHGDR